MSESKKLQELEREKREDCETEPAKHLRCLRLEQKAETIKRRRSWKAGEEVVVVVTVGSEERRKRDREERKG